MASKAKKIDFDPYKILQLDHGCEPGQIDRAYKKHALRWHPDKNPDQKEKAQEMFLKIYQAYEFLKDAAAKTEYDEGMAAKKRRAEFEEARQTASSAQRKAHLAKLHEAEARVAAAGQKRKSDQNVREQLVEELRREGARMMQRMKEEQEEKLRKAQQQQKRGAGEQPKTGGGRPGGAANQQLRNEVDELEKALFGGTVM